MQSLETKHPQMQGVQTQDPPAQDAEVTLAPRRRSPLLLPLAAYLLGVATTFLLLRSQAAPPSATTLLVLGGVGLGTLAAAWLYRSGRQRPRGKRPVPSPRQPRPARPGAVGQDLPTVTDYYENAADGVMTPQAPHRWEPLPPVPDVAPLAMPPGGRQPVLG